MTTSRDLQTTKLLLIVTKAEHTPADAHLLLQDFLLPTGRAEEELVFARIVQKRSRENVEIVQSQRRSSGLSTPRSLQNDSVTCTDDDYAFSSRLERFLESLPSGWTMMMVGTPTTPKMRHTSVVRSSLSSAKKKHKIITRL